MGKEQSPNDQCCGSALVSMWIRIQLFIQMRIQMRIRIQGTNLLRIHAAWSDFKITKSRFFHEKILQVGAVQ
jgi:hypothetical protein